MNLIVKCDTKKEYIKLMEIFPWNIGPYTVETRINYFDKYPEDFSADVKDGKITGYTRYEFYKNEPDFKNYTFTNFKQINKMPKVGDRVMVLERYYYGEKIDDDDNGEFRDVKTIYSADSFRLKDEVYVSESEGDKWILLEEEKEEYGCIKSLYGLGVAEALYPPEEMQKTQSVISKELNKSLTKKTMSVIKNAFTSKEDKALAHFGLGTTKELTDRGREEFVDFMFETGSTDKKEFLKKVVEAYKEDK